MANTFGIVRTDRVRVPFLFLRVLMYSRKTIIERLAAASSALQNTLGDETLVEIFTTYGYPGERLAEGRRLVAAAEAAQDDLEVRRGRQAEAAHVFRAARTETGAVYMRHLKTARIALEAHPTAADRLALRGTRAGRFALWTKQMDQFYRHARQDAEITHLLAGMNVPPEALEAGHEAVETLRTLHDRHLVARSEAQRATGRRNAAMRALDAWVQRFLRVARLALVDDPQQLEKLGVAVA